MAYHTRRSGPPGPGMGRGLSLGRGLSVGRGAQPVMYPQRSSMRSQNSNYGNSRNESPQQSGQQLSGGSHNNYSGQQHLTHQPPPPPPQHQQQQQHHQQQQQPQQQQQQQQQQQMPVKPPVKIEEPPPPMPAPPAPPPLSTDTNSSQMDVEGLASGDTKRDGDSEESNDVKARPWLKKKVPGFKINKKVKRRRQNARLRKILQPKNAIMVLNELKTGIKFTFQEHTNALTQTMFVVNAEVDGKSYTGQGLSKPLAKQNAAENALKDLLLQKMADAAMKSIISEGDTPEPMVIEPPVNDAESIDGNSDVGKTVAPEDDVPWGSLASFALYKLFTEWQSQGTHVPITRTPTGSPSQPVKATAPAPMKKIPDNPTERHPVMLLNQLRPGVEFKEVSREGAPPNLIFTLAVSIDGASYTGIAKNKKDAKKEAAKSALAGSFNIHYD